MSKVIWELMFRVSNEQKAKAELKKAINKFWSAVDIEDCRFEKYHKIPELYVCEFDITLHSEDPSKIISSVLSDAKSIANSWLISGMLFDESTIEGFEGIYSKESSHSSISSFEWGQFQILNSSS